MSLPATPFDKFLLDMASSFRRIAHATKGDMTEHDLHSEAWLTAASISEARGGPIDYADLDDQNLVMGHLYIKFVRRRDWQLGAAARLDDDSTEGITLAERLPAHEEADPLIAMLAREAADESQLLLRNSYSQLAAYSRAFENFEFDLVKLCAHMVITAPTLRRRLTSARDSFLGQHSLWDRKGQIGKRFKPLAGRRRLAPTLADITSEQHCWEF